MSDSERLPRAGAHLGSMGHAADVFKGRGRNVARGNGSDKAAQP